MNVRQHKTWQLTCGCENLPGQCGKLLDKIWSTYTGWCIKKHPERWR